MAAPGRRQWKSQFSRVGFVLPPVHPPVRSERRALAPSYPEEGGVRVDCRARECFHRPEGVSDATSCPRLPRFQPWQRPVHSGHRREYRGCSVSGPSRWTWASGSLREPSLAASGTELLRYQTGDADDGGLHRPLSLLSPRAPFSAPNWPPCAQVAHVVQGATRSSGQMARMAPGVWLRNPTQARNRPQQCRCHVATATTASRGLSLLRGHGRVGRGHRRGDETSRPEGRPRTHLAFHGHNSGSGKRPWPWTSTQTSSLRTAQTQCQGAAEHEPLNARGVGAVRTVRGWRRRAQDKARNEEVPELSDCATRGSTSTRAGATAWRTRRRPSRAVQNPSEDAVPLLATWVGRYPEGLLRSMYHMWNLQARGKKAKNTRFLSTHGKTDRWDCAS